ERWIVHGVRRAAPRGRRVRDSSIQRRPPLSLVEQRMALGLAVAVAALRGTAATPAVAAEHPPPPPSSIVCPSIEEDGMLCASDSLGLDGNCTHFIGASDRLGAVYRTE